MAAFTFAELTPTDFLMRSAMVFRDRPAIVDGNRRFSYGEFHDRARRLTGLLAGLGVTPGDRVAALCLNSHVMLELHHGVPLRGAVLVPLNTRLLARELAYIVEHSGARVLVASGELADRAREVAATVGVRLIIAGAGSDGRDEYENLLAASDPRVVGCDDERGLLAINYTSGTTGVPKGVMYAHRGAYLQALAVALHTRLDASSVYLWTLPMFHCNGWCFPWAVTATGGTHVCLRGIDTVEIWRLLRTEGVTHFSAAPTVLTMIASAPAALGAPLARSIEVQTGGAPPTPTLLARMSALGMDVTHLYGLTETYGPIAINEWQPQWQQLPREEQATLRARQGVANVVAQGLRVVDIDGQDVPPDGSTMGEVVVRGNDVMLGYYLDPEGTATADLGGWFRTGDLAVRHDDGYLELRDRSKDIIITGGENVSSVELERVIDAHPAVLESAVVGRDDDKWGQVPIAFVTRAPGAEVTTQDIVAHVRENLAHFKTPRQVVFQDLPKTSTGKIQKNRLRNTAAEK